MTKSRNSMDYHDLDYDVFCSDRQLEMLASLRKTGSQVATAKELGIARNTVAVSLLRIREKAARGAYAPECDLTVPSPIGFGMKGTTQQRGADGTLERQWVRHWESKQEYVDFLREITKEIVAEEVVPLRDIPPGPTEGDKQKDIIPWIQIGDAHLGMLAHAEEVGQNFDLKIAERELLHAIGMLIRELPSGERVVINDLGDFTHYENFSGTTEASGHALDFDTRFPKMIRVYVRLMRNVVEMCLEKFDHVDVIINQGNHSRTNDFWMAILLRSLYEESGRVHVLNNDSVFVAYRMGNTLVMVHHSDKCKPLQLPNVMATDYKKDWGETDYHYIDIGHIHHKMTSKEHPGVIVESWNILANADKYAHDHGYRSRQSITAVLRSRKYGEIGRRVLPILEVRDAIEAACKREKKPRGKVSIEAPDRVFRV